MTLHRDAIPDHGSVFDQRVVANLTIRTDARRRKHMRERPDSRPRANFLGFDDRGGMHGILAKRCGYTAHLPALSARPGAGPPQSLCGARRGYLRGKFASPRAESRAEFYHAAGTPRSLFDPP